MAKVRELNLQSGVKVAKLLSKTKELKFLFDGNLQLKAGCN